MAEAQQLPANWAGLLQDYDPNDHLVQLERWDKRQNKKIVNDYLNVQGRLMWFLKDQRALVAAGAATTSYIVRTELVEHDKETKWANFKTYVRDVMGNEATMYGSESASDFGDYLEKASTKSLGRALLLLGYGTAFADELDEGERVVDSPVEHKEDKKPTPLRKPQQQAQAAPAQPQAKPKPAPVAQADQPITPTQFITAFREANGISKEAFRYFVEFGLKIDAQNLEEIVKRIRGNAEKIAQVRCINWAMQQQHTPTVLQTYMMREKLATWAAVWASIEANADDVKIALDLIKTQG